ncbi:MAG: ribose 5-phosphate isomerase A, partial [Caldithrix sp. RBG_13_44_9]
YKSQAAEKAVEFLEDGMIIGLGSGTTAQFALRRIGELVASGKLGKIIGIPSSRQTDRIARRLAIPLGEINDFPEIDLTIDGADEVDPQLNLIKGGGGALLREKIIIQASKRVIIIVDESKISTRLGKKWPVPVEVLPFSWKCEERFLASLAGKVMLRKTNSGKPYKTDQNNFILDVKFSQIKQPEELVKKLNERAGIIGHGIFLESATDVIVAGKKGISHLKRYNLL